MKKQHRAYFADALQHLVSERVPHELIELWDMDGLSDFANLHTKVPWTTGTAIIEAAELMVESAVENGNLTEDGEWLHG